ncbi:MAG: hypothetical protein R2932_41640 [Caldilineaceae bacterium]
MKYLLDTNACIRFLNGRSPSIQQEMRKHKSEDILLCSVVKAELLVGMLKMTIQQAVSEKFSPFSIALHHYPLMMMQPLPMRKFGQIWRSKEYRLVQTIF